ncbi:MAG: glycosyltransferase family 4 protein [Desulfobacterales bacterium]|nr:glycosyltransferase family 4 protein [Desulfobacterales bacterium]
MNKPQRILVITPSAYILSGLATWLDYLEPGLRSQGWEVVVGLVAGPRFHLPERYLAEHPHQEWLPVYCGTGTAEGRVQAVCKAIKKVRPALVVSVNIPDAILGVARLRRAGWKELRVAMAVHGIQPDLYRDMSAHRDLLDGVICTNRLACELAAVVGEMERSRIYYAPCGVDLPRPGKGNPTRNPDKAMRIAWVGRLEQEQKRIHDLEGIVKSLASRDVSFTLLIAGTGPEETSLAEQLTDAVAREQVIFLGYLSPYELRTRVFEEADVLLVTSSWETGPLVIWEVMAHGIAVVSSAYVGSGRERALKDKNNVLLFDVGDTRGATDCLEKLSRDPDLRQALAGQGEKLIRERYTIGTSVRNWRRAFARIAEHPPLGSHALEPAQPPAGRLDRLLGRRGAEGLRALLRTRAGVSDPSGEWPHTHSGSAPDDEGFWVVAKQLDRRG